MKNMPMLAFAVCLFISGQNAFTQETADPSLILHLSFDELHGNRALDHSQYQNHGTLVGNPQLVNGKFGKALKFNGVSDWVEVPHHNSLTVDKNVTVMAWIQTSRHRGPAGAQWQGILAKSNGPRSYSLYTDAGGPLHLSAGVGSASRTKVVLNTWQHVVAQVDNGWHRYWINGKNAGNFDLNARLPGTADTQSVLIGRTHEGHREFLGLMDEVRIYNRALSEGEIIALMRNGHPPTPGRVPDINGDGSVNILDLVIVSQRFGERGQNDADVNGDGIVNISDLVLVAWAVGQTAAPALMDTASLKNLTVAEVRRWLSAAYQIRSADISHQEGILILQRLLSVLTPKENRLLPNYPNPFNPETWIPYHLSDPAEVTLTIYAVDGKVVRRLDLRHQPAGYYQSKSRAAYWDGRNAVGERVASGLYFYTLTAADFSATKKMLIRK